MKNINRIKRGIANPVLIKNKFKKINNFFLYKLTNRSLYPLRFFIYINSICNQKCKTCDIGQQNINTNFYKLTQKGSGLTLGAFKKFIDDIKKFKPSIDIKGTEPLLVPNLEEFIKYVRNNKLKCSITTNGLLLEKYAKQLVEAELNTLQVSIDGPPNLHDKIRGVKGSFKKAYNGIKKIQEFKKTLNSKYPEIYVNCTISNLNYNYLIELFNSLKDLNLKYIRFQLMNFITKDMATSHNNLFENFCKTIPSTVTDIIDPSKIDTNIIYNQIKEIRKLSKNTNTKIGFFPDLDYEELNKYFHQPEKFLKNFKHCYYPWLISGINANGDIIPFIRCYDYIIGNINNEKFTSIWNNKKYKLFRKTIKKSGGAFPACTRCCGIYAETSLL